MEAAACVGTSERHTLRADELVEASAVVGTPSSNDGSAAPFSSFCTTGSVNKGLRLRAEQSARDDYAGEHR